MSDQSKPITEAVINQSRAMRLRMGYPKQFRQCFKPVWKIYDQRTLARLRKECHGFDRAVAFVLEE